MFKHSLTAKRIFLNACLSISAILILSTDASVAAQNPDYASERQRAMELFDEQKFAAAMPLLEKLVKIKTDDVTVWEQLGWSTMVVAASMKDPTARKQARERARQAFLRAKELGDDSNLLHAGLEGVSGPDPADATFSKNKQADTAMREAEAAYSRGDLAKALSDYERAFELDPELYEAALFAGDMEFKKGYNSTDPQSRSDAFNRAGVWFAKAIAVGADRETAYRYWGDALDAQGKTNEARDKFVDAIVAEPYKRGVYAGLTQWADRHNVGMGHPKIDQPPPSMKSEKSGDQTTVLIDPGKLDSKNPARYWSFYDLTRATYKTASFAKEYPDEKEYRHSLKEEATALRIVAEIASRDLKDGKVKSLDESLSNLIKLNDAGLLEAYILFARPDQGIARDYETYRKANREKLRRYWLEVVIGRS
jgi:tetratricopeptide (TPR) repeat protein